MLKEILTGKGRSSVQHIVVGISDMRISGNPNDLLITYSLGSCIGLALYDKNLRVGGLIHCMLPMSNADPDKAKLSPFMFVDTGVATMLQEFFNLGSSRKNIVAKVAGASSLLDVTGMFKIGERNYTTLRKFLLKNDILIAAEDIGGSKARTMCILVQNGETRVKSQGIEVAL
jgi:chemotaxis protein CheD